MKKSMILMIITFYLFNCLPKLDETPIHLSRIDTLLRIIQFENQGLEPNPEPIIEPIESELPLLLPALFSHGSGIYSEGQFVTIYKPQDSPINSKIFISIDGTEPICGDDSIFNFDYPESTSYFSVSTIIITIHCHPDFRNSDLSSIYLEFIY